MCRDQSPTRCRCGPANPRPDPSGSAAPVQCCPARDRRLCTSPPGSRKSRSSCAAPGSPSPARRRASASVRISKGSPPAAAVRRPASPRPRSIGLSRPHFAVCHAPRRRPALGLLRAFSPLLSYTLPGFRDRMLPAGSLSDDASLS